MSAFQPEPPDDAPNFAPTTDAFIPEEEAFDRLEQSIEGGPDDVDLVVAADPPTPIGRSWAFDWGLRTFMQPGGRGPLATYGMATLAGWVEKALHTARGAHPVHPADYGFDQPDSLIGGGVGTLPADLEDRIRACVTFHERITDIDQFSYAYDPDIEELRVFFLIVLDDDTEQQISSVLSL
jgi:hypothetical protein